MAITTLYDETGSLISRVLGLFTAKLKVTLAPILRMGKLRQVKVKLAF